jgi:hypothetical protein
VEESAAGIPGHPPILAALCCTHYGYSLAAFRRALAGAFPGRWTILDPNQAMSSHFGPLPRSREQPRAQVEVNVVSRIPWSAQKIAAISAALEPVSRLTAQALRGYRHDPDLFAS